MSAALQQATAWLPEIVAAPGFLDGLPAQLGANTTPDHAAAVATLLLLARDAGLMPRRALADVDGTAAGLDHARRQVNRLLADMAAAAGRAADAITPPAGEADGLALAVADSQDDRPPLLSVQWSAALALHIYLHDLGSGDPVERRLLAQATDCLLVCGPGGTWSQDMVGLDLDEYAECTWDLAGRVALDALLLGETSGEAAWAAIDEDARSQMQDDQFMDAWGHLSDYLASGHAALRAVKGMRGGRALGRMLAWVRRQRPAVYRSTLGAWARDVWVADRRLRRRYHDLDNGCVSGLGFVFVSQTAFEADMLEGQGEADMGADECNEYGVYLTAPQTGGLGVLVDWLTICEVQSRLAGRLADLGGQQEDDDASAIL